VSFQEIIQSILEGDPERTEGLVRAEMEAGTAPAVLLNDALTAAMDQAGQKLSSGEMFIPEILFAADAMKAGLDIIKPHLLDGEQGIKGTVVIGGVKGDFHDIGKTLVAWMLEGAGFEVIDLGVDVPSEKFLETAQEHDADIVAMSTLMVTTMPMMDTNIKLMRAAGLDVKVVLGGAPVSQSYADRVGADGYASDAPNAVTLVRELIG
jgi:5-methyltetrahydrofolate--homocysteine methyltransferase